jgi:hypothetical protein
MAWWWCAIYLGGGLEGGGGARFNNAAKAAVKSNAGPLEAYLKTLSSELFICFWVGGNLREVVEAATTHPHYLDRPLQTSVDCLHFDRVSV